MGTKIYKVNTSVKVIFQALGGQTGITDLSMIVYDPDDNASSPVTMTELSDGLYESSFTPDEVGRWWIKITSVTYPANAVKESYFIGYQEQVGGTILQNTDGDKVSVIQDGSLERLACNMDGSEITISDSESATKYQLRSDYDAAGDTLNTSTDTVLFSFSGASGVLDFVACVGSNSSYEIAIEIDGTERLRISMSDLGSLGLSNATNVDVWAETANKNFRFRPTQVGFTTGFRILAKAKIGTPTVKHLALYRERL